MPVRDLSIAALVIALCAWLVIWQFNDDPVAEAGPIEAIAIGDLLEVDFALRDAEPVTKPRNLMAWYGRKATVLYTWSVPCPCIEEVEPRLRRLHERLGLPQREVSWVALAGEPKDELEAIREKLASLGAFYRLLHDPDQKVCRRLGLVHSGQVAVLDGAGRLVYRGSIDGDYDEGQAEHLAEVLDTVIAGRPVLLPEREREYGCEFSVPLSCLEFEDSP